MTSSRRLESDVHPEVLSSAAHKNPDHNPMILELPSEMYALFHYIFLKIYGIISIMKFIFLRFHVLWRTDQKCVPSSSKNPGIPT